MSNITREQQLEAVRKLKERAEQLLSAASIICVVETFNEEENGCCDPSIEFGDSGIGVLAYTDYETCELCSSKKEALLYGAYTTHYHPAVMYCPGGSGEPPSTDTEELGESSDRPEGPLTEAIKTFVEYSINSMLEVEAKDEEAEEYDD